MHELKSKTSIISLLRRVKLLFFKILFAIFKDTFANFWNNIFSDLPVVKGLALQSRSMSNYCFKLQLDSKNKLFGICEISCLFRKVYFFKKIVLIAHVKYYLRYWKKKSNWQLYHTINLTSIFDPKCSCAVLCKPDISQLILLSCMLCQCLHVRNIVSYL